MKSRIVFSTIGLFFWTLLGFSQTEKKLFFKNITLIDGTGSPALKNSNLLISGDTIAGINLNADPSGAIVLDMKGKTIMPGIINAHGHLGLLKGTSVASENYTRDNIIRQLIKYQSFGVLAVLCLGTDYDMIFGLRDSSRSGKLPGAMVFTAGFGFGVTGGGPAFNFTTSKVFRPSSPEEASAQVKELAKRKPDIIKMWVDDFYGQYPKMQSAIFKAIIKAAHQQGIRVAAHVFHLEDARELVDAGIDVLAHSIRDKEIDESLLTKIKDKGIWYIPTLSLDEYQFIYTRRPDWINDPFFKASLEPGVLEMITSTTYLDKLRTNPSFSKMEYYFQNALLNLKKIYHHGIKVALGTDSGATPVRAQGFSEHLEMELMTEAGLTPLEAISCATQSGSRLLRIDDQYGTLKIGKKANFIVLLNDPSDNIRNTRSISSVWKEGVEVSLGPLE